MAVTVTEGEILAGKYRVEKILGEGGMGYVVAARHTELDQPVAIKLLQPEITQDAMVVERFKREARAAARVENEHVVRVLDVAELPSGAPYMVMEYLDGEDLAHRLEREGALDPGEAVDCVLEACVALAEAHESGIVHRDLKPANLFLAKRKSGPPIIKLLDFGISKQKQEVNASLTSTQMMMGTPLYMSPEQIRSTRDVDGRSDIWSLGIILYECLTGEVPFAAETMAGIIAVVITETPKPLAERNAAVPAGLGAVVDRCLAKDRAVRYQSVIELARDLAPFASQRGRRALERIVAVSGHMPSHAAMPTVLHANGAGPGADAGSPDAPAPATALHGSGQVAPPATAAHGPPSRDAATRGAAPLEGTGASTRASWASPSADAPGKAKSHAALIAGALAVAVLALGGGALALRSSGGTGSSGATPSSTAAPEPMGTFTILGTPPATVSSLTPPPDTASAEPPEPPPPEPQAKPKTPTHHHGTPATAHSGRPAASASEPQGKPTATPQPAPSQKTMNMGIK